MLTCVCGSWDELMLLLIRTVFLCVRGSNHTSATCLFSVQLHKEMNISTGTVCRNGACFVHHAHTTPSPFFWCPSFAHFLPFPPAAMFACTTHLFLCLFWFVFSPWTIKPRWLGLKHSSFSVLFFCVLHWPLQLILGSLLCPIVPPCLTECPCLWTPEGGMHLSKWGGLGKGGCFLMVCESLCKKAVACGNVLPGCGWIPRFQPWSEHSSFHLEGRQLFPSDFAVASRQNGYVSSFRLILKMLFTKEKKKTLFVRNVLTVSADKGTKAFSLLCLSFALRHLPASLSVSVSLSLSLCLSLSLSLNLAFPSPCPHSVIISVLCFVMLLICNVYLFPHP